MVLLLFCSSFYFNYFGVLAVQIHNTNYLPLGEALTWVLLPSQCTNVLLNLDTELIQVG